MNQLTPPIATIIPETTNYHNDIRIDNYAWLKDKTNPETHKYIKLENEYANSILNDSNELRETLYNEMVGRIQETDSSVPYNRGEYWYYTRTEEGKQYPLFCRKLGSLDAPEEVYLDENVLAEGHSQFVLSGQSISPDNRYFAYTINTNGDEIYTLHIKDLRTNTIVESSISGISSNLVWANDNHTLFYTKFNEAKRPFQMYRHTLGSPETEDVLVHQDDRDFMFLGMRRTKSGKYIVVSAGNFDNSHSWYFSADEPNATPIEIMPYVQGVQRSLDHSGEYFYKITNEYGSNNAIYRVPVADAANGRWTEIVPHRVNVKIENYSFYENHCAIVERQNGLKYIVCIDLLTLESHNVPVEEDDYTLDLEHQVYESATVRYSLASLLKPTAIYDYNMIDRTQELKKQYEIRGEFDASRYEARRVFAPTQDGTMIPISIVHKKGLELNGANPLYLYGYGAYGITNDPAFSSIRLSLLDRGFVFAIAHIRGSGYLGKEWHNQAKLMKKKVVFDDFIACAEYFITEKYTSPNKLVISGGSAGGTLVCAAMNKRPDLFHIVIARVPAVDSLTRLLDTSIAGAIAHFDEIGNPQIEEQYHYIKSYSPYENVIAQDYPHIFLTCGLNDPRVQYWQPAKLAAKLRALKTDHNTLIFKTSMNSGHFGASGRYEHLRQTADEYAFILEHIS
ncbi:MAG: S9 family peptidase [Ignavibacteria bacterium]|nr:S9 family peptidase [Ignavibacteria bacterium]